MPGPVLGKYWLYLQILQLPLSRPPSESSSSHEWPHWKSGAKLYPPQGVVVVVVMVVKGGGGGGGVWCSHKCRGPQPAFVDDEMTWQYPGMQTRR